MVSPPLVGVEIALTLMNMHNLLPILSVHEIISTCFYQLEDSCAYRFAISFKRFGCYISYT
ncbi:unnamed protein product [Staurois parvus]|uniref:Uncharacterized protein n=1 Tax=Staurois parvus TaxID=386267 RepID=A0ABN9E8K3_9NEOB|nr:unnamed protein product [Staurois parvus]